MSDPAHRSPGHASRGIWILILALLTPAVVIPLLVPLYARAEPSFAGFPFFYWFQFLLICCAAVITITAFYLSELAGRRDRGEDR